MIKINKGAKTKQKNKRKRKKIKLTFISQHSIL